MKFSVEILKLSVVVIIPNDNSGGFNFKLFVQNDEIIVGVRRAQRSNYTSGTCYSNFLSLIMVYCICVYTLIADQPGLFWKI